MTSLRLIALIVAALSVLSADVRVVLSSAQLTAGDLSAVIPQWSEVPASTALAPAPLPGVNRQVTKSQLISWGRTHGVGIDASMLPERLVVERETRRLNEAEALSVIRDAISRKYGRSLDSVRFVAEGFVEPIVPAGELVFAVAGALTLNEPRSIRLRWTEPGGRTGGANIRGRVEILGYYLRANTDIPAGEELRAADFDVIQGSLPGQSKLYLASPAELAGMASMRSIREGDSITRDDLRPAVVVRRGDLIELHLTAGAVRLRAPAKAEQNGSVGDMIRCRNLQSNQMVEALVRSSRSAEVYQ